MYTLEIEGKKKEKPKNILSFVVPQETQHSAATSKRNHNVRSWNGALGQNVGWL